MKKWQKVVTGGLTLLAVVALVGCGGKKTTEKPKASKSDAKAAASAKNSYTPTADMKSDYDIVIIGAGGAGMTAAMEAKDAGMNPVILEKMPVAGGNTSKSSAGMNASETTVEKTQGVADDNQKFFDETLKGGGGTNDQALLRYFVDHSASAIDWLAKNEIVLDNLTTTGGMSVSRTHRPSDGSAVGQYLVKGLEKNIRSRDIPLFVNSDVTKIIETDGKISGVKVKVDETDTKTITTKAVIVTTGGFGANKEMIKKYRPDLKDYVSTNAAGSTGDGIKMIEKLGGDTVDLDKIQIHPTVFKKTGYLVTEAVRGEGAILVNKAGKRFTNEMNTRDKVSAAELMQPGKSAYIVFGDKTKTAVKAIDQYMSKGMVVSAKTLAELAEKTGIDKTELEKTVKTWQTTVATKTDSEFGRTTGMTNDIDGTYYAIAVSPGIHHTMGGVKINTETQVLKKDGTVIKGLYAAGEVTGGLHGSNRIGGNAVADIIIFGRQAGTQAAAYVK
ncbi:flavocytochrome c [Pseudolactococcus carnosus]|uniref:flavocytochrome c n=1 Tax=Pseudolactococcus carnosus TaxID=2749961 RepID=UPI0008129830|nr:flavocytochrome c [Lactococcus carnosus]SCA91891.1 Fumarate reductase flavoprotein subunit [Lactococcus piscium]MCJ1968837.1 flavocytochrome c [Lactococcus carnosus]MCJ1971072.1 flavocytochrome c [Lactococcus carnosus]MCJ1987817.1 flavocytochrome c [Lactococcus carnosus]MCJ2004332.1 flavocytochrome c [Lactococcus carnosus]